MGDIMIYKIKDSTRKNRIEAYDKDNYLVGGGCYFTFYGF